MNIRKSLWSNEMGTEVKCSGVYQTLKKDLRQWLHNKTFVFYEARINALIRSWNIVMEIVGDYVEKYGCKPVLYRYNLIADTFDCLRKLHTVHLRPGQLRPDNCVPRYLHP